MHPSLVLSSIVRDITTLARACVRNNDEPDIEVVVSRDMQTVLSEAMNEDTPELPPLSPFVEINHARITTLWAADGCFAIVRFRKSS